MPLVNDKPGELAPHHRHTRDWIGFEDPLIISANRPTTLERHRRVPRQRHRRGHHPRSDPGAVSAAGYSRSRHRQLGIDRHQAQPAHSSPEGFEKLRGRSSSPRDAIAGVRDRSGRAGRSRNAPRALPALRNPSRPAIPSPHWGASGLARPACSSQVANIHDVLLLSRCDRASSWEPYAAFSQDRRTGNPTFEHETVS